MNIDRATAADVDAIVPLFEQYRGFYRRDPDAAGARIFLADRIGRGESVLLVARDADGTELGFTQLYPGFSSLGMSRSFTLSDLFVIPGARRRGVARALLDAAASFAREAGATGMVLETAHDNLSAQALYREAGWIRDETYQTWELRI